MAVQPAAHAPSGRAGCDSLRASPSLHYHCPHIYRRMCTHPLQPTLLGRDLSTYSRVDGAEPVSESRHRSSTQTLIPSPQACNTRTTLPHPRQGSRGEESMRASGAQAGTSSTLRVELPAMAVAPPLCLQPSRGRSSKRRPTYFLTSRTRHLGPQLGR